MIDGVFEVIDAQPRHTRVKISDGTPGPDALVFSGYQWIEFRCVSCDRAFRALRGQRGRSGTFVLHVMADGAVSVVCPAGLHQGTVEGKEFLRWRT